jgi:hypothetical protein
VNGGIVLTGKVYVWYWIRTRLPKRLWKRCMEYKMKTKTGKFETYHIDKLTGTARKVSTVLLSTYNKRNWNVFDIVTYRNPFNAS